MIEETNIEIAEGIAFSQTALRRVQQTNRFVLCGAQTKARVVATLAIIHRLEATQSSPATKFRKHYVMQSL